MAESTEAAGALEPRAAAPGGEEEDGCPDSDLEAQRCPAPSLLGLRDAAAKEAGLALEEVDVEAPPLPPEPLAAEEAAPGGGGRAELGDGGPELEEEDSPMMPATARAAQERLHGLAAASLDKARSERKQLPWCRLLVKVSVSVALFLGLSLFLEFEADETVTAVSREFIELGGLKALFLCVLLADSLPQPFTYIPLIFIAVKGAVPKPVVFAVCALASYTAALLGYGLGRSLRGPRWAKARFARWSAEHPYLEDLMERKGALGVLAAAALPVPLAVATWSAGFFGVRLPCFLVAALGRCPKIAVFVLLSPGPASV